MLCAVVRSRGSTPQVSGALMLVDDAATLLGTVGGGCVEAEVRRQAMELLAEGRSALLRFRLDSDYGWDDGLICGGTVEIAVAELPAMEALERCLVAHAAGDPASIELRLADERGDHRFEIHLPPRERLLIAGAGHVGQALARLGAGLDFEVELFDDRPQCLAAAADLGATPVLGDIAARLASAPVDHRTYAVVVTRGHRHDAEALAALLDRGARYLGMIGSRRKVAVIFDELRARGARDEALRQVRAPIGLAIGSVTVEEIALSIAAELVQVRRSERRAAGDDGSPATSAESRGRTEPLSPRRPHQLASVDRAGG